MLIAAGFKFKARKLVFGLGIMVLMASMLLSNSSLSGAATTPPPKIILVVVIDALRADHLSCYGYPRKTSPFIDRLEHEATSFTQAITAGGWTGAAVPSILTGVYPTLHQIDVWKKPRNPEVSTIAYLLKRNGYLSALFSNHPALDLLDIKDGFNRIVIMDSTELNSALLTQKVLEWFGENEANHVFAYLHYLGAHSPYLPPEPHKSKFINDPWRFHKNLSIDVNNPNDADPGTIPYPVIEDGITDAGYYIAQYDGAISYTDEQIGRLIEGLKKMGRYDETLLFVTSDHGELLGEHEIYFDHVGCYESNIRVPLLVKYSHNQGRGVRLTRQVSLTDIVPTILDVTQTAMPPYIQGKSLSKLLNDDSAILHPYVYTQKYPQISIRSERWKIIHDGNRFCLYDIVEDPLEIRDLSGVQKGELERLIAVFNMYERERTTPKMQEGTVLSKRQVKILKSLGYLR
jgi:arylsulfatase